MDREGCRWWLIVSCSDLLEWPERAQHRDSKVSLVPDRAPWFPDCLPAFVLSTVIIVRLNRITRLCDWSGYVRPRLSDQRLLRLGEAVSPVCTSGANLSGQNARDQHVTLIGGQDRFSGGRSWSSICPACGASTQK